MTTQSASFTAASALLVNATAPPFAQAQSTNLGRRLAAFGHGNVELEAEARRSFQQRMQHIVAVAGPGEGSAGNGAAMLLIGHHIGHELAGVGIVSETVYHRHGSMFGQFQQPLMGRCADHDGVDITRQDPGRIGDGFASTELHLRPGEHNGLASELAHADIEGDTCARGGLVENHRKHLAFKRAASFASLQPALAGDRIVKNSAQIGRRDGREISEMA